MKVARPPIVKAPEVTDAWAATGCTSGQRAIRIGNSETYCSVPPSGLQHALGAGAARETRFDAEGGPTSAVVTPVRMSEALGIAFESSFRDGVKVEIMRSLCQVNKFFINLFIGPPPELLLHQLLLLFHCIITLFIYFLG